MYKCLKYFFLLLLVLFLASCSSKLENTKQLSSNDFIIYKKYCDNQSKEDKNIVYEKISKEAKNQILLNFLQENSPSSTNNSYENLINEKDLKINNKNFYKDYDLDEFCLELEAQIEDIDALIYQMKIDDYCNKYEQENL